MLRKEGRVTQEQPQVQRTAAELKLAGINPKKAKNGNNINLDKDASLEILRRDDSL